MGSPWDPEDPEFTSCSGCCVLLPDALYLTVMLQSGITWEGTVTRDDDNSCEFHGSLSDGLGHNTDGGALFCQTDLGRYYAGIGIGMFTSCQVFDGGCHPNIQCTTITDARVILKG